MLNKQRIQNYRLLRSLEGGSIFNPKEAKELSGCKQESLDALARNEEVFNSYTLRYIKDLLGIKYLKCYFAVYKPGNKEVGIQFWEATLEAEKDEIEAAINFMRDASLDASESNPLYVDNLISFRAGVIASRK